MSTRVVTFLLVAAVAALGAWHFGYLGNREPSLETQRTHYLNEAAITNPALNRATAQDSRAADRVFARALLASDARLEQMDWSSSVQPRIDELVKSDRLLAADLMKPGRVSSNFELDVANHGEAVNAARAALGLPPRND